MADHRTFLGAVIDRNAVERLQHAIDRVKADPAQEVLAGGTTSTARGWFVDPTIVRTENPTAFTLSEELFGPFLAVHVYDDATWA